MAVQIGAQGQAGFDRPFALMSDCHRRIEHFLTIFQRVVDRYARVPLDQEARTALTVSARYFRESAPNHTADEEESLFPRLRSLDRRDLDALLTEAERLEREHDRAKLLHDSVDARIGRWLDAGELGEGEIGELQYELDALSVLYAGHIEFEDRTLFPRAQCVLTTEAIREIGSEMAARRGKSYPSGPA